MKKLALITALLLCVGLIGCGETSNESSKSEKKSISSTVPSETTTTTTTTAPLNESTSEESKAETTTTAKPEEEKNILPANEEQIKKDLQENLEIVEKAKLTIDSVTIDNRTMKKQKKDETIYLTAEFSGPMCKGSITGQAEYRLSNEGWGFRSFSQESVTSEPTREPTEEDCLHIYEELYKEDSASHTDISTEFYLENKDNPDFADTYVWEYTYQIDGESHLDSVFFSLTWSDLDCLWRIYSGQGTKDLDGIVQSSIINEEYITSPDLIELSE